MQTLQQVENYTALSERASEYLLAVIRSKPNAVICLATGATPLLRNFPTPAYRAAAGAA